MALICSLANAQSDYTSLEVSTLNLKAGETGSVKVSISNVASGLNVIGFDVLIPAELEVVMNRTIPKYETNGLGDFFDISTGIHKPEAGYSGASSVSFILMAKDLRDPESVFFDDDYVSISVKAKDDFNGICSLNDVFANATKETVHVKYRIGSFGKGGYSSYSNSKNVLFEETTSAYIANLEEGEDGSTIVKLIETACAPEETAVILKGEEGQPIYAINGSSVDVKDADVSSNVLIGSVRGLVANDVHVLTTEKDEATGKNVTGFYKYSGWIPAGKAYLDLEGKTNAPLRVVIEDVNGIQEVAAEDLDGVIFNLNGQKVNEAKKGIYVVNGKKVMF